MKTKELFCAQCQKVTEHATAIDQNGEYLFTCDCGRFVKFSGDLDAAGLEAAMAAHETGNQGQISQAEIDAANQEKLAILDQI